MPVSETVFMFSGQGSHYYEMGRELYEKDDTFRDWMIRLDSIVQELSGNAVIETLYSGKHGIAEPFDRTLLTHPAIFMVEFALTQTLIQAGILPDIVLGVSLGSFAAAAVAGFIDVEDALTAVMRQAMLIEASCEVGGMIAILADPALFAEDFLGGHSELAAVNFSSHFVISARKAELAKIETALRQRDIGYQRLPVSFPFHSQWIDKAKAPFESFMRSIRCKRGRLPMVCCDQMDIRSEVSHVYFWNVVRNPIRFRETMARFGKQHDRRYIDVGPSDTLATFLKYSMPPNSNSTVHPILTPYGRDQKNLAALLAVNQTLRLCTDDKPLAGG
jgi:bacillaene synthase trans-acting acyltransferase